MKKKPPLLPTLALTAMAGAAVFLAMTAPSCDPRVAGADRDAPAAQGRAYAAAAGTPVTADDDFRPKEAARGTNTLSGFAETARVLAARRDFLMLADRWEPGERAEEIARNAREYRWLRAQWAGWMLGNRAGLADVPGRLAAARIKMDGLRTDVSALKAEARKEWEAWEAKNWSGYVPAEALVAETLFGLKKDDFSTLTAKSGPDDTPAAWAAADFQVRRNALVLPLLHQLEQLQEDSSGARPPFVLFDKSAPEGPEESPAQAAERQRQSDLAARLRNQLDDLMSQSRLLTGRWQDRGWESYAPGAAGSNTLPAPGN
jgi:hypothetical protein